MRPLLACTAALALAGCVAAEDDALRPGDLPPGAASLTAEGASLDVAANHCELFVDGVVTTRGSNSSLRVLMYLATTNDRLDDDIAEVAYYARVQARGNCGEPAVCAFRDEWRAYPARAFANADDYWLLDFTIAHNFTAPLVYEGAFYVRTTSGKTYWSRPAKASTFVVDQPLAFDVETLLVDLDRGISPASAVKTADDFPYLNPKRCR